MSLPKGNNIVLYDGECPFCSSAVLFIIHRDKKATFSFAQLQSQGARDILRQNNIEVSEILDTIYLIESGKIYIRSTAALRIARKLDGLWPIFSIFVIVPKVIRDVIYDLVGKHRHTFFKSKQSICELVPKEYKERFLNTVR